MTRVFFLSILMSFIGIQAFSQPASPEILGITYSHENFYTISWTATVVGEGFEISTFDGVNNNGNAPKYKPLKTELSSLFTVVEIPEDTVIFFAVEQTVNGVPSAANTGLWPWKNAPSNILLKQTFDSCSLNITLTWNQYYYPDPKQGLYYIYCNGDRLSKINYTLLNDTTCTIGYAEYSKRFTEDKIEFQVDKMDGSNMFCSSNKIIFEKPEVRSNPSFIEANGTNVWDEQYPLSTTDMEALSDMEPTKVKLNFYVDPLSELDKFVVYRSKDNEVTGFDSIGVAQGVPYLSYEDTEADSIATRQYFYKIAVLNNCSQAGIESNIESTIPLRMKSTNSINILEWDEYKRFKGKLKDYSLYRVRANQKDELVMSYNGTSAMDDLSKIENKDVKETVCYYVVASEENNPNSVNARVVSNLVCMRLPEDINMPKLLVLQDGCTPQSQDIYHFKPAGGVAKPTSFYMAITDHWGTKVFETNDINKGWNGAYNNNSAVPSGGYIYYYKYTGKTGTVEKHGLFVVLCP